MSIPKGKNRKISPAYVWKKWLTSLRSKQKKKSKHQPEWLTISPPGPHRYISMWKEIWWIGHTGWWSISGVIWQFTTRVLTLLGIYLKEIVTDAHATYIQGWSETTNSPAIKFRLNKVWFIHIIKYYAVNTNLFSKNDGWNLSTIHFYQLYWDIIHIWSNSPI